MSQSDDEKLKDEQFLKDLAKSASATKATIKLNAKPKEVSIYRHGSQVQSLEDQVLEIDTQLKEENQGLKNKNIIDALNKQKVIIEKQLEVLDADMIEGILYPLTYRDINLIKAAATEALFALQEHNFDAPVIMTRILAEERYMTVFCSLRKKDNPNQRYFNSLEEIATADDVSILTLYKEWEKHFVLSDEELKN